MREHEFKPAAGSQKNRRRVGRGNASGHGTYSGKGLKGQKARTGGSIRRGFEGGQLALIKRLPHKRGFKNPFRIEYQAINLERLSDFDSGTEINPEMLRELGIIKNTKQPIVILSEGDLNHPLTIKAHRFSKTAKEKILAAGGAVEELVKPVISRPR
jgi:large subunit ribosomal protein L15